MVDVLTFDQAIASAAPDSKGNPGKKHLMLGNGFSVALFPNIFNYKTLAENIESERIKQLFAAIDTNDFEFVMRRLFEAAHIVSHYDNNQEIYAALNDDIEELTHHLMMLCSSDRQPLSISVSPLFPYFYSLHLVVTSGDQQRRGSHKCEMSHYLVGLHYLSPEAAS